MRRHRTARLRHDPDQSDAKLGYSQITLVPGAELPAAGNRYAAPLQLPRSASRPVNRGDARLPRVLLFRINDGWPARSGILASNGIVRRVGVPFCPRGALMARLLCPARVNA